MVKVQCLSIELALGLIHMVGETFVILYVHLVFFLRFFSFNTKVSIYIHEYANEIIFI